MELLRATSGDRREAGSGFFPDPNDAGRTEVVIFQPLGDALMESAAETAERLVDGFEIAAHGLSDLFAWLALFVARGQDLPGPGRQGIKAEVQRSLAGRGRFVYFIESRGDGGQRFRGKEQWKTGTAAAGFEDFPRGNPPRPSSERTTQIKVIKFFPKGAADFLKDVLAGVDIADDRSDERPQIPLGFGEKGEEIGRCHGNRKAEGKGMEWNGASGPRNSLRRKPER